MPLVQDGYNSSGGKNYKIVSTPKKTPVKTYIYKPATINGQPANGATRVIKRDANTGALISDTGYLNSSGTGAAPGVTVQGVVQDQRSGSAPIQSQPNWSSVSVGQVKAAGYNNLSEYKAAYNKGTAPNPAMVKPIQTFSGGTYNPNTGGFIDNQGRGYSTVDPAKLNSQLTSGPAVKSAGLNTNSMSNAPTTSIVAAVATKTVIDENSTPSDVIKAGNEVLARTQKLKASGAFDNIKAAPRTGYDFGTYQGKGGIISLGPLDQIFGETHQIATDRNTGQTYKLVQTGDTTFGKNTIGLDKTEKELINQKIYGIPIKPNTGGFLGFGADYSVTGEVIELGVKTAPSKKEKAAFEQYLQNVNMNQASFKFAAGLTLGGGSRVVNTAKQAAAPVIAKTGASGALQTLKPYLISAGLYAGGTQAPELARQVALQTNREQLKGVDVGTEKFDKVIGSTFTKTNQDYFGGTNYEVNEAGEVVKTNTVKGKAGSLQKFVVGAFPGLKANPVDIYDDDFRDNLKVEYKKVYGKDLTTTQADAIVNTYLYAAGTGQAVGQISQEVASEYAFRNLAKSTIPNVMKNTTAGTWKSGARLGGALAVEAAPFGFLEGSTGEITQSSFEKQDQDLARITTAGLSGAVTSSAFNFVGGGLTGRFGNKGGKVTQLLGWGFDPPGEIIGDKLTDVATKGGLKVTIPGIATTSTSQGGNTTTSTNANTKTNSKADKLKTKLGGMSMVDLGLYNMTSSESATMNQALQSQLNNEQQSKKSNLTQGEKNAVNKAQNQFSNWLNTGAITIEPAVGINNAVNSDTENQGGSNTNTNDNTNNNNNNNNNNNVNNDNSTTNNTDVFNEENTNNEVNNEVNVDIFNDNSTATTSVNIPIVTPAGGSAFPFFFPFAGSSKGKKGKGGKLLYYNELDQARGFYEGLQYGGKLPSKKKKGAKK